MRRVSWLLWVLAGCPPPVARDMPWVARATAPVSACPEVKGYAEGFLFDDHLAGDADLDDCYGEPCQGAPVAPEYPVSIATRQAAPSFLPDPLRAYCLYVPTGGFAGPLLLGAGWTVSRSANVVTAGGPAWSRDAAPDDGSCDWTSLREFFAAETERNAALCALPSGPPAVRLTFLDTVPTGELSPSATDPLDAGHGDGHGAVLARTIDELICPVGVPCPVDLRTRIALPERRVGGDHVWEVEDGGFYGPLVWLAQAIVREVNEFEEARLAGTAPAHLVLGLSLGWHADWNRVHAPNNGERADVDAVHDALRYARCRGALVFAAVGNRVGASGGVSLDDGALFPAAWDQEPVDCAPFGTTEAGAVLLHAVGAVGADHAPLAISRDASARLVAYGQNFDSAATSSFTPLTGTSGAAAIVAAAAAELWAESRNAGLTPEELVNDLLPGTCLFANGNESPVTGAAKCDGGALLVQACVVEGGPPEVSTCEPNNDWKVDPCPPAGCAGGATRDLLTSWLLAPSSAYDPFAHPQPSTAPCPVCAIDWTPPTGDPRLTFDLVTLRTATLTNVRFATLTGGVWAEVPIAPPPRPNYGTVQILGLPAGAPVPTRAMLKFDANGGSYFSEVRVLP